MCAYKMRTHRSASYWRAIRLVSASFHFADTLLLVAHPGAFRYDVHNLIVY